MRPHRSLRALAESAQLLRFGLDLISNRTDFDTLIVPLSVDRVYCEALSAVCNYAKFLNSAFLTERMVTLLSRMNVTRVVLISARITAFRCEACMVWLIEFFNDNFFLHRAPTAVAACYPNEFNISSILVHRSWT